MVQWLRHHNFTVGISVRFRLGLIFSSRAEGSPRKGGALGGVEAGRVAPGLGRALLRERGKAGGSAAGLAAFFSGRPPQRGGATKRGPGKARRG